VSSEALDVVNRWRASNFERGAVDDVLAEDVEWVVPERGGQTTLRGIDAVLGWYEEGGAADVGVPEQLGDPDGFDVSEERGELEDFGEAGSVRSTGWSTRRRSQAMSRMRELPDSCTPCAPGRSFAMNSRVSASPRVHGAPVD
jgi:hypothetical protein